MTYVTFCSAYAACEMKQTLTSDQMHYIRYDTLQSYKVNKIIRGIEKLFLLNSYVPKLNLRSDCQDGINLSKQFRKNVMIYCNDCIHV